MEGTQSIPVLKRKRGRPPKVPKDNSSLSIDFPISHLAESNARQIQFGYRILQDILKLSKTKHLVEKPDENLFGLHDYYTVIKKPLWFDEVSRKFSYQEYKGIKEVINDIKLVLENCYRFWGSKHKFSKQAFRIEKLLDKELRVIPQNVRELCAMDTAEEESSANQESNSSFFVDDFSSKILKFLDKREKEEASMKKEIYNEQKDELIKWESEVLLIKQYKKQITYMPELAEIGHFLHLCHEVLCLKKISQCEIERMLLIPKESTTLATIMTALLCPSAMRGSLYFKPVMVYEVWSKFLARKVDSWYNNFLKIGNKTQIFIRYGIETTFWEAAGEVNPLINSDFSSISFTKRVWILKTLCTTIFHSYKKIEEYFNSVDEACLRGPVVYEDGKFDYISLFLPEVRVYRICRSEMDIDNKGEAIAIIPVKNGFPPDIQFQGQGENSFLKSLAKKNKFYLAANDTESLNSLIKVFSQKKKSLSALRGLLTSCEQSESKTLDALYSMKKQWEKYKERSTVNINNSIKYWLEKENSPPISPGEHNQSLLFRSDGESFESRSSSDASLLGKRQLKKKYSLEDWENSSDSSIDFNKLEEDTSDWEEGNIRRKGKRKFRWSRWRESFPGDTFPIRPDIIRGCQAPKTPTPTMSSSPSFPSLQPPVVNPVLNQTGMLPSPAPNPQGHAQQPVRPSLPFLGQSPQPSSSHPQPMYRPTYGRGRGRGTRMRFYPPLPIKKLVRRPSIVASEISNSEADQHIRDGPDPNVLTISLKPEEKVISTITPSTLTPLKKISPFDDDLLLNDLQAIKIEPPPWIQFSSLESDSSSK